LAISLFNKLLEKLGKNFQMPHRIIQTNHPTEILGQPLGLMKDAADRRLI